LTREQGTLNFWAKLKIKSVQGNSLRPYSRRLLLNLGCGVTFHPDWTNADLFPAAPGILKQNLEKPRRFARESFEGVYHSHVLEHLPKRVGEAFLKECFRVLRPGGVLRVVVPDLEAIARLYIRYCEDAWNRASGAAECHEWMTLELLDQMTRESTGGEMLRFWRRDPLPAAELVRQRMGAEFLRAVSSSHGGAGTEWRRPGFLSALRFRRCGEIHRWMYDRASLRLLLEGIGFVGARVCRADESVIPSFSEFHLDTDAEGRVRKPDSLFMEALKP
jgi:SAM-dependent methyltransferase